MACRRSATTPAPTVFAGFATAASPSGARFSTTPCCRARETPARWWRSARRSRTCCATTADGLRSVVARRLGLAHSAPWPRRLALVAHYRGVAETSEYVELHVERDGFV